MFGLEIDGSVVLEQMEVLEKALSTDPATQRRLQKLVRQTVLEVRAQVVASASFANGDPRQSRMAVRTSVYKKILGGNVNIIRSRRSHGGGLYVQQHANRQGLPGGNRIKPTAETLRAQSYGPLDRGYVLWFVAHGTNVRQTRYGNRGSITGNNWFEPLARSRMEAATQRLSALIDKEFSDIMDNTDK